MKTVFHYLKPYNLRMLFGFTIKVLGTLMDLGLPWVLAFIIDDIIPIGKVSLILWWGVVMILLSVGARTFNIIANRMAARVGSSQLLYEKWNEKVKENIRDSDKRDFEQNVKCIIRDFDQLELTDVKKPRVGVVGEILVKYHPTANNDIVSILEEGGAEAIVPDLMDYILYSTYNARFRFRYLAGSKLNMEASNFAAYYIHRFRKQLSKELERSKRFHPLTPIEELAELASGILSLGNQTGEGWLVTAEMLELIEQGTDNIICVQPLACLPNHVAGKGMFKPIKERYPNANIIPIDYDPGISSVNQLNRIKLMLSVAFKKIKEQ